MKANQIVGYSRFTSKKGFDTLIVDIVAEATPFDVQHGRVGMKTEQVFLPDTCFSKITPDCVGKILKRHVVPNGRYVQIVDIEII